MELKLIRHPERYSTPGELFVDDEWECFTLEDIDRNLEEGGEKIPKQTAIPLGTYPVVIDFSSRFQRYMLHVLNVPQFQGIRIHAGNTTSDTEGCILVGQKFDQHDNLLHSRDALDNLTELVVQALKEGEVNLTIEREES